MHWSRPSGHLAESLARRVELEHLVGVPAAVLYQGCQLVQINFHCGTYVV